MSYKMSLKSFSLKKKKLVNDRRKNAVVKTLCTRIYAMFMLKCALFYMIFTQL